MKSRTAPGKKRIGLTVDAACYEKLRALIAELGWPDNWFSVQVDQLQHGLLLVAEQARKDAENNLVMTEAEAKKRYEEMMRKIMEG